MDGLCGQEALTMHRFFAESVPAERCIAALSPEDAKHAATVLRLKAGDEVEVICDRVLWRALIIEADPRCVKVEMQDPLPSTEPDLKVTLFQGIPKSDKMDWIVQKSTEIGVSRIVPIEMSRCVARILKTDMDRKLRRWEKIAREAAKQSGRSMVPEILPVYSLAELETLPALPQVNAVPWEETAGFGPLAFYHRYPSVPSLGILIGPEGGISPEEINGLKDLGFQPITLGKRILRTETAGLAAASVFMSLYGEMDRT